MSEPTIRDVMGIIVDMQARMATKDDLRQIRSEVATKEDLKQFATKEDLNNFATKKDLERFATKEDLNDFATKDDLKPFATKDDLMGVKDEIVDGALDVFERITSQIDEVHRDVKKIRHGLAAVAAKD